MPWIVFALTSVFLYSISALIQRVLMKDDKSDAHAYSIVFQILGAVVVGTFALFRGFVVPPILQFPVNFLLLAVLYGLGTYFLFKSLQYIEVSEVTIITSVRAVVTIISAVLLLGEVFNLQKAIGTAIILASTFIVTEKVGKIKFDKGVLYALGMALCYGLGITNDAYLLKYVNVFSFTTFGFLLPGLFLIAIKPKAIFQLKQFTKPKIFSKMLILDVCYGTAAISFYWAIDLGAKASQITPILLSSVIVTVILAAIFLKERDHLVKKLFCAILVTIGVLLLT